jgi:hypothetical protein
VEIHSEPETAGLTPREFVADHSIGTDFALRFGRSVFCARLPMREEMLRRAGEYLNGLNDEYYSGEADYQWSGYSDDCVHALHNALAAAGVWGPKSIQGTKLRQFFNLAVPANTFVELAPLASEYPIEAVRPGGLPEREQRGLRHAAALRWSLPADRREPPALLRPL